MKPLKYGIYALIALLFLGVLWYKGPIAQDPLYHQFADQRTLLGVPNFWNVVSNIPMFFLGVYGFKVVFQRFAWRPDFASRWIPVVLVLGIFITSFGSGYYHYAPDNETLIWDRLPMTLMFMPVFSLLIYDLEGARAGFWAFVITVPLGLWSIFYWKETEMQGAGDLRPYAFVQFFPMLIGPIMILLARAKHGYIRYFWLVLGWYVIAKVFEHLDVATYQVLGFWSGHTLKHLIGAISLYYLLVLVKAWDDSLARLSAVD